MDSVDLEDFSFKKWYPKFVGASIEAIPLCIPNDVMKYLRESSIILPEEAVTKNIVQWEGFDDAPELKQPTFPNFSSKLKDAMNTLGGEVFIKLNWSAPKDAAWITSNKSLKCTSLEDIYLLLKGSEDISKDISYDFKNSVPENVGCHCVVLKRWIEVHPGSEFRCFVMDHELFAISQRDCLAYYEHIMQKKYDIMKDITQFFKRKVKKKFPLPHYTFDIIRNHKGKIILVDFNPLNERSTDPLLFTWDEIWEQQSTNDVDQSGECSTRDPEFRFLGEDPGLQPKPCKHFGVPYEVIQLCDAQSKLSLLDYIMKETETQNSSEEE